MLKLTQKSLKRFESIIHWLVITLLMFIPLYMKFPFLKIPGTFVSIRLEDILIFGTLGLWIIYLLVSGEYKKFIKDKLIQSLLVFFVVGAASLYSGSFLTQTVRFHLGVFHFLRRVEILLLFPLAMWVVRKKQRAYLYLIVLSLVVFLVDIYAVGQRFLHFPAISTINPELSKGQIYYLSKFDRVGSTFSGHYDLAVFLMLSIIVILGFLFYFLDRKKNGRKKISVLLLFSSLIVLSFYVLVITAARLSFVTTILGVFALFFLLRKGRYIFLLFLLLIAFFLFPSNLRNRYIATFKVNIERTWNGYKAVNKEQEARSGLNIPTLPSSGKRIKTVGSESPDIAPGEPVNLTNLAVYRSSAIRTNVEWPRAIRAFTKNPLLGTGFSSLGLATDNDFLRALGEVGLLGVMAIFLFFFEVIKRVWFNFRHNRGFLKYFSAACIAMILAMITNSLFIDVFEASKVASLFWMVIGFNLGMGGLEGKIHK